MEPTRVHTNNEVQCFLHILVIRFTLRFASLRYAGHQLQPFDPSGKTFSSFVVISQILILCTVSYTHKTK
jgi:hypothetical protein